MGNDLESRMVCLGGELNEVVSGLTLLINALTNEAEEVNIKDVDNLLYILLDKLQLASKKYNELQEELVNN